MPWWSRRARVPAAALAGLSLGGERPLAAAPVPGGGWLVATDRALWIPSRGASRRVPWERVDRGTWDRDAGRLMIVEAAPLGQQPRRHAVHLDGGEQILPVVHERVTATVVVAEHVPIEGRRGVRVVGRRVPGTAALSWSVAVDPGLDVSRPAVRDAVAQALAQVRARVGE